MRVKLLTPCLLACLWFASAWVVSAQTQPTPTPSPAANAPASSPITPKAHPLQKFVGRYELETGLIPISTLDITLAGDELWLKPSLIKKRKLIQKSKLTFVDEVAGQRYKFTRDAEGRITSITFDYEGASYTAQRVQLPAPSLKGNTTFRLKGHPKARVVVLSGSFNEWNQSQLLFAREGDDWVCRIDLEPGRYTYKFILDGNWLLDPANPDTEEDAAGNINNVLVVGDK